MYQRKGFFSNEYHTEETLKPKPVESKKKKADGPEYKNLSIATLPHGFEVTYEDKGTVVSTVYDGKGAVVGTKSSPIVIPEVCPIHTDYRVLMLTEPALISYDPMLYSFALYSMC